MPCILTIYKKHVKISSVVEVCAGIAQLVEQLICNQQVGGSSPSTSSNLSAAQQSEYGGIPEWPKGADCKSVVSDFGGSNPPSPTNPEHESVRDFRIFTEKSVYFKWERVDSERLILPDPYFDPLYGGFRQSNLTT